ncbi:MAG: heme-copper oxidase subunit III [Pyrinomonadaceae bacterium]
MEVGTAETIVEAEELRRRHTGTLGGSNPPNSGGRNPGGSGSNGPSDDDIANDTRFIPEKSRLLTGFLLLVVAMTFGGLMAAYVVLATNRSLEWQPFALPIQVWISTVIIIASSVTYHFAKTKIELDQREVARIWFIITTILGAAFISSQILSWLELTKRGLYVQGNPYAGFFYILTAVHAVHVVGGIVALGSVLLRVWHPTSNSGATAKRKVIAQVVGWYWHFMGGIWIVLFLLLGFWQ